MAESAFVSDPRRSAAALSNNAVAQNQGVVNTTPAAGGAESILSYKPRASDKFNASNYDVENLTFPNDLFGADNQYGNNYIVFYISVQNASKVNVSNKGYNKSNFVSSDKSASSSGQKSGVATEKNTGAGSISSLTISKIGTILNTGKAIASGDIGAVVGGSASVLGSGELLTEAASSTRSTSRLKAAIALHTPNVITATYGTSWEGEDTAKEQMGAFRFGGMDESKIISTLAKHVALSGGGLGNLLGAQTGQAANSKKEMLFKGVDFREFTFEYKFAPRSIEELIKAQNIIKMFKLHMHPEFIENTGNYLYLYPSEFDILHYNGTGESKHLPRYTSCVLTSMTTDYTPNGNFTAFGNSFSTSNGAPTEINIRLQFKELAQLTKAEIADGY